MYVIQYIRKGYRNHFIASVPTKSFGPENARKFTTAADAEAYIRLLIHEHKEPMTDYTVVGLLPWALAEGRARAEQEWHRFQEAGR